MLVSCKYCCGIHNRKEVCSKKPRKGKEPTTASKFRSTRLWGNKSKEIRQRDLFLCQLCVLDKKYTFDNLEVHHIEPLCESWNLRLDNENLITLCSFHHKQADNHEIERELLKNLAINNELKGTAPLLRGGLF